MGRRKGELTGAGIDRGWPHQVILSAGGYGDYTAKYNFCNDQSLSLAVRGHSVVRNDEWCNVYCFAEREHAERFMAEFGGEWFEPKTRGRGHRWHLLKSADN